MPNTDADERLARSIEAEGQLVPIKVTEVPGGRFAVVDGVRRVLISQHLGRTHVVALVYPANTGVERMV